MTSQAGYVVEDAPEGRTLVVTGAWSDEVGERPSRGARRTALSSTTRAGFSEGNLDFLDGSWGVHRLNILDRGMTNLRDSLQALSLQATPSAELDLGVLPHLQSVAGEGD